MAEHGPKQADSSDPVAGAALRCGAVELCPATRRLRVGGSTVSIERRAFDLLAYLMHHPDRVVDKDELWRKVWQSRPVSESTLPQAVSRVRRALGKHADRCITTVYGVGYRFDGPVEHVPDAPPAVPLLGRPVAIGLGLLLVVALVVAWWNVASPPVPENMRVAVLPVQNDTGDAELAWVTYGVLPLIDRALADGGVDRVRTGAVLSTLRRHPGAERPEAQTRVLRRSAGADRVLVPRLSVADRGYVLELRSADDRDQAVAVSLEGDDVTVLAVAAGTTVSERLSRWQGAGRARRSLVTDDPFVNQAFARGLDARLRGRYEDAARFFDTVLAAAPDLLDAKYHLSLVTRRLGDWDYTEKLNGELLSAATADGDHGMLAAVQSVSGTLAWRRGDKNAAQRWYEQALNNYLAQGNADYIASTTANLGILAASRGDFAAAERGFRDALAHYRASGDRFNEATTLKNLGNLFTDQGRYDEAETTLLEALEIRQALALPVEVALTISVLADIEMSRGHWQRAMAYHERVLATAMEHDSPLMEAHARADLSAVLRRLGRLEQARLMAARSLSIAIELESPTNQGLALLAQGRVEHALGHWQRAAELFGEAVAVYERIGQPLGHAISLVAAAEALIEADRLDEARERLSEASRLISGSTLTTLEPGLVRAQAALAARQGETAVALQRMEQAYRAALEAEAQIDGLDFGGQLGLMMLEQGVAPARTEELARSLTPRAEASADALLFLVRFHRTGDPARALQWAERRRRLLGEAWTSADQRELLELRRQAGS